MHVLYVHPNFPAQFGHVAERLVQMGHRCTFVSTTPAGQVGGIEKIQYTPAGGATKNTHFTSRSFENAIWHCQAVYDALLRRTDIVPDLIVGHSGFGSTLFLRELFGATPILNFFEYFYRPHDPANDMNYRTDLGWPTLPQQYQRARCRNAMILLDLAECQAGYAPTEYQRSLFPAEWRGKIDVIFDGIDRSIYHGYGETLRPALAERGVRAIAGVEVGPQTRVVTYVSRGFESMRGFDIFMQVAQRIIEQADFDVRFIVVGEDKIAYGGDENYIAPHKTFREWVLSRGKFDLGRFSFVGRVPPEELGRILASGDLHIYLTVPFVLSWSMMDALSCGAVVLASDTPPVREMIRDGENGLLAGFFDVEGMAARAIEALRDPAAHRPLGRAGEAMIESHYSLEVVLPKMLALYERLCTRHPRPAELPQRHRPPPASPFAG
jgi:glycosyltransferase involved in cell wall biosynthesis